MYESHKHSTLESVEAVLFDLDGTLIDHFRTIYRCYCHALEQMGLEPRSFEEVKAAVGGGIRVTFSRLVPASHVERGVELWTQKFDQIWNEDIEILNGVEVLLERLHAHGITTAILTNKEGQPARRIANELGWTERVSAVFGRLDTEWVKPAAELTRHVLTQVGAVPETTIFIGDSPFDVETGQNAGLRVYTVATGSHSEEQLRETGPDGVFPDMPALARALFGWNLDERLKKG